MIDSKIEIKKKRNALKDLFGALPKLKNVNLKKVRKDLENKHKT